MDAGPCACGATSRRRPVLGARGRVRTYLRWLWWCTVAHTQNLRTRKTVTMRKGKMRGGIDGCRSLRVRRDEPSVDRARSPQCLPPVPPEPRQRTLVRATGQQGAEQTGAVAG